ncbi:hypothetical protein DIE14_10755 [Burkholderia sp. Bp9017]|uniref:Uncharacterized protein n=1 Tax=Burkholderia anthina TaxID=179879 RepID=A0A7T6VKA9_9BURK|nr:hypothetical protein [Burkholderia anthina]QQK05450.1 hypothetical protein JFN94_29720 [Burkholderia anthina]RQZ27672.1 hypothetical protein DIE14_10755 [Burkholderia sp. Bp9017]RQZ35502.1 hypothetical protein DIE13_09350 [Burkholderia sp. Bp9016]
MKRPFEWQTRLRHAHGGRRAAGDGFVSLIAGAALIVVLSVMNSFRTEVCDRMLSVLAHVEIFSPSGTLPDWGLPASQIVTEHYGLRRRALCGCAGAADQRRSRDEHSDVPPAPERLLGIRFLTPSVYFLGALPSELATADVIAIAAAAFLMSCVATLYPSWRAARVRPAEALRDE